jgi:hypothetical protein
MPAMNSENFELVMDKAGTKHQVITQAGDRIVVK